VLATGTEIQHNEKGEPAPVDVYTLEVTPQEGETLGLAAAEGKLQFALRNYADTEKVLTNGVTIPQALASLRGAGPTKKKSYRRTTMTVEVIKDGKIIKKKVSI
jgi:pilus assembly protein CpaB